MSEYKPPHKVKDNIYKTIFEQSELFIDFFEKFVSIDVLKNLSPENIEDISPRHLPLFTDATDSPISWQNARKKTTPGMKRK